jgi:hypothetical protein
MVIETSIFCQVKSVIHLDINCEIIRLVDLDIKAGLNTDLGDVMNGHL